MKFLFNFISFFLNFILKINGPRHAQLWPHLYADCAYINQEFTNKILNTFTLGKATNFPIPPGEDLFLGPLFVQRREENGGFEKFFVIFF